MPFEKIPNNKLSLFVVNQIEQMILRGILRPGTRLPAERNLADRLGVSRPSLRDAISILTNNGLLDELKVLIPLIITLVPEPDIPPLSLIHI